MIERAVRMFVKHIKYVRIITRHKKEIRKLMSIEENDQIKESKDNTKH